jgi:hypothetical protein
MSSCSICIGKCESSLYQLTHFEFEEESYFKCPRCKRFFKLEEEEDSETIEILQNQFALAKDSVTEKKKC